MTDEERQKLIKRLREVRFMSTSYEPLCSEAADEIERLARLVEDYKLTFGDIHIVSTATIKTTGYNMEGDGGPLLETAADLIEQLAHKLVATDERLEQLEARVEALERM